MFISNTTDFYSTKLTKIDDVTFKTEYYDNSKGEKFEDIFKSFERGSTTIIGIPTFGLYKRGIRDSLVLYESVS